MASFKMKNQVCVYIFHQSMGSHVLRLPAGRAGRAFRKVSGELEPVRGASHPSEIDIWWPFLPSAPPEGGPDIFLPLGPVLAKGPLLGASPQPAALKRESPLKRPMFEQRSLCDLHIYEHTHTHTHVVFREKRLPR